MVHVNILQNIAVDPDIQAANEVLPVSGFHASNSSEFDYDAALALWNNAQTASVFNHPGWWKAAIHCYGEGRRLYAIAVSVGSELCGYWLLWEKRLGPKDAFVRVIEPVGARHTDYIMPLVARGYDRRVVIGAMLDALKPRLGADAILLWPKAEGADGADGAIGAAFADGNFLVHRKIRRCPRMTLPVSYEELKSRWSRNHRTQLRRRKKRLREIGELTYFVAQSREEIAAGYDRMMALHRANWDKRSAGSEFHKTGNVCFVETVAQGLPLDLIHYSEVRVGGRAVSCNLDFRLGDEVLLYKGAFDINYSRYSPGMVHLAMHAEWAIESDIAVLDFMQGEEDYKFLWADGVQETATHAIAGRTAFPVWFWNTKLRNLIIEYKN